MFRLWHPKRGGQQSQLPTLPDYQNRDFRQYRVASRLGDGHLPGVSA